MASTFGGGNTNFLPIHENRVSMKENNSIYQKNVIEQRPDGILSFQPGGGLADKKAYEPIETYNQNAGQSFGGKALD